MRILMITRKSSKLLSQVESYRTLGLDIHVEHTLKKGEEVFLQGFYKMLVVEYELLDVLHYSSLKSYSKSARVLLVSENQVKEDYFKVLEFADDVIFTEMNAIMLYNKIMADSKSQKSYLKFHYIIDELLFEPHLKLLSNQKEGFRLTLIESYLLEILIQNPNRYIRQSKINNYLFKRKKIKHICYDSTLVALEKKLSYCNTSIKIERHLDFGYRLSY